jgi:hypothetical protein
MCTAKSTQVFLAALAAYKAIPDARVLFNFTSQLQTCMET